MKHGYGVFIWKTAGKASQKKYKGHYLNDLFHGKGKLISPLGEKYNGEFKNGMKHGKGTIIWADGEKYDG